MARALIPDNRNMDIAAFEMICLPTIRRRLGKLTELSTLREAHLGHLGGISCWPVEACYNQRHPVIAPLLHLDSIGWNQYHWEHVGWIDWSGARVEEINGPGP